MIKSVNMPPAANTARPRRVAGSATAPADSDSDVEFHAYDGRLKEASAARARLRKVSTQHQPFLPSGYRKKHNVMY